MEQVNHGAGESWSEKIMERVNHGASKLWSG